MNVREYLPLFLICSIYNYLKTNKKPSYKVLLGFLSVEVI